MRRQMYFKGGLAMLYRIMQCRFDCPWKAWREFSANSDQEAQQRFEDAKKEPRLKWDTLRLVRVDQVEKTTGIDIFVPK